MAYYYNPIYWQTACLTVNSGSLEVDEDAKKKSTNYGKVAEAIGKLKSKGAKVLQPLINKAEFGFVPDTENDAIIFSLKGIVGIGDEIAHAVLQNRPYASFDDFYNRMYKPTVIGQTEDGVDIMGSLVKKSHVIKLIKAGAFNEFDEPRKIMLEFLSKESETKETLNMQNMKSIIELGLLDDRELSIYKELYNFKSYISKMVVRTDVVLKGKREIKDKILGLDKAATEFFYSCDLLNMQENMIVGYNGSNLEVSEKLFLKAYNNAMETFKNIITTPDFIKKYNRSVIKRTWMQYAQGSVAKWEMDSISYYEGKHELDNVNREKYNIVSFFDLSPEPVVFGYNEFKGKKFPKQKVFSIMGTILDRDSNKNTISVLTPEGVVNVKTFGGSFSHYNKQISRKVGDKKEVVEKSWFTRGNLVLLNGFRRDDQFILKTYKVQGEPIQHTINLIKNVDKDGELTLQDERIRV